MGEIVFLIAICKGGGHGGVGGMESRREVDPLVEGEEGDEPLPSSLKGRGCRRTVNGFHQCDYVPLPEGVGSGNGFYHEDLRGEGIG